MGESLTKAADIAAWAETHPSNLHKGKGSQLTHEQLNAMVTLRRLNKTQAEIAQAIGCDQATVSRYLKDLIPTGEYAAALLRAKQAELAEKFVDRAKGSDILDLLERFEAIPARKDNGKNTLQVTIGGEGNDVKVAIAAGAFASQNPVSERKGAESLAITSGSDNPSSVNQG